MEMLRNITRSTFLIRLKRWEYWPFGIIQFPALVYWLWLSIRARSLVFFSASNPGIPMGGMFGESKFAVLNSIPRQYIPATLRVELPTTPAQVFGAIREAGLALPLIFKPDIGERGFMVTRICNEEDVQRFISKARTDFLVQEWISLPLEFGVFYMKFPGDEKGKVISVTAKEMLSVTGDGTSALQELILQNERARLQWEKLRVLYAMSLNDVMPAGESIELVSIGNHAQGTRFVNANHLIDHRLSETFDQISSNIPGFYFGRFDLRCASVEALYEGKVKILELNGCGAEPGHIYDMDFSLWEAIKTPVLYWDHIYKIARANRKKGFSYVSHREALAYYRKFRSAVR